MLFYENIADTLSMTISINENNIIDENGLEL